MTQQQQIWYAIGLSNRTTNMIWFLADGMYNDLDRSMKQADEWHGAMPVDTSVVWEIFVIPSVNGLCSMSNAEQLALHKDALYKK